MRHWAAGLGLLFAVALQGQTITVLAGTKVGVTLTQVVWMRGAKAGDGVYGDTNFPVVIDRQIAIAPGTKVQGVLDVMVLPTRGSDRAELRLSFSNLVFANGYAEACEGSATFSVVVSRNSDVLLDQGTQVEFSLVRDLVLLEPLPGVKRMPVRRSNPRRGVCRHRLLREFSRQLFRVRGSPDQVGGRDAWNAGDSMSGSTIGLKRSG